MVKKRPKPKTQRAVPPKEACGSDSIEDTITAALNILPTPALVKVCRLCESKDGPFINIFDGDKVTAKKISELMPFRIEENDDFPHRICFRCSAKVEELYEFVQKCIKTQESLHSAVDKGPPLSLYIRGRTRTQWVINLQKCNLSNDDICATVVEKAMEGIKGIVSQPEDDEDTHPSLIGKRVKVIRVDTPSPTPTPILQTDSTNIETDTSIKILPVEKKIEKVTTRATRSAKSEPKPYIDSTKEKKLTVTKKTPLKPVPTENSTEIPSKPENGDDTSSDTGKEKSNEDNDVEIVQIKTETAPPFNIMDHVSIIKVNSVGILYQCRLCNRNFLKKDVVLSHGCAKNNIPKDKIALNVPPPEAPKPPNTVKYIKSTSSLKKPEVKPAIENKVVPPPVEVQPVSQPAPVPKPKPRIGPASRIRRNSAYHSDAPNETSPAKTNTPAVSAPPEPAVPSVSFPTIPSLNSRYKLVPGPNNTFSLIEDAAQAEVERNQGQPGPEKPPVSVAPHLRKKGRPAAIESGTFTRIPIQAEQPNDVLDLDSDVPEKPYPVGLFQTVPHHSAVYPPSQPQPPFTTPAMKKQSYTIVQTGNPSKLLISAKPQSEEPQKKRSRRKQEVPNIETESFNTAIEDPNAPKGFFTFINVDPLLQPSYVLPTDNIIQESQISTSTPAASHGRTGTSSKDKDKHSCHLCGESFNREKKLHSHIQAHFSQMDAEDKLRAQKSSTSKRKLRNT